MNDEVTFALEQLRTEIAALRSEKNILVGRVLALEASFGTALARWGSTPAELAPHICEALQRVESDMKSAGFTSDSLEGLQKTGQVFLEVLVRK